MKYIFKSGAFMLLLSGIFLATSCKKWLDVSPSTQLKEAEQFSDRQGYVDALFGIYQKTTATALYGSELSFGMLEVLAQRYENKNATNETFGGLARYNFTGADGYGTESKINAIWSEMYSTIAQCNFLLKNLNPDNKILTQVEYGVIKGEALGMRAFLHFDLLRMFGLAYLEGVNADAPAIPYMDQFQVKPQDRLTVAQVLKRCETDLLEAEQLLKIHQNIDQMGMVTSDAAADLLFEYRQNHLNYWAVKAVLARLYLYMGNKEAAYTHAHEVTQHDQFNFIAVAQLEPDPNAASVNATFSMEHIFSIYASKMKTTTDKVFQPEETGIPGAADLFSTKAKLNTLYETTLAGHALDIRSLTANKPYWYEHNVSAVYTKKFLVGVKNARSSLIPLIRLSEMYYILAEASPTLEEGTGYLNEVRTARLIPALMVPDNDLALQEEILKEYRKEFYGEGQLWYYYKRKNATVIPDGFNVVMNQNRYVFPLPNIELEYGK